MASDLKVKIRRGDNNNAGSETQSPTKSPTAIYHSDYDDYDRYGAGDASPMSDGSWNTTPSTLSRDPSKQYSLQYGNKANNYTNNLAPVPESHDRDRSESYGRNPSLNSIDSEILTEAKQDASNRKYSDSMDPSAANAANMRGNINTIMIERVSTGGTLAKEVLGGAGGAVGSVAKQANRAVLHPYYQLNGVNFLTQDCDRFFEISQTSDSMQELRTRIFNTESRAYSIIPNMPISKGVFLIKIGIDQIHNQENPLIGLGVISSRHEVISRYLLNQFSSRKSARTLSQFAASGDAAEASEDVKTDFGEALSELICGHDEESIGIFFGNQIWHDNEVIKTIPFSKKFTTNDVVTIIVDGTNRRLSFKMNDANLGVVCDNLDATLRNEESSGSDRQGRQGCFYPIFTLGQQTAITILEVSMLNKPVAIEYNTETKTQILRSKWAKNKNFQMSYIKGNAGSKIKCKAVSSKCAIYNHVMQPNSDRIYRYRFEVSSMKERDKELPKLGFGLVSKNLVEYSKRKIKQYPTWIDVTNRFNTFWIYGTSLVHNTKLHKNTFGQNTGQLFHSGDMIEMVVDFTRNTSHKVKFKYNDAFVATAFDDINILLNSNQVKIDTKDGYGRPLDTSAADTASNANTPASPASPASPEARADGVFEGCQCALVMGTRGNQVNLKSATCEYTIQQLVEPSIPNAMEPIFLPSDELFRLIHRIAPSPHTNNNLFLAALGPFGSLPPAAAGLTAPDQVANNPRDPNNANNVVTTGPVSEDANIRAQVVTPPNNTAVAARGIDHVLGVSISDVPRMDPHNVSSDGASEIPLPQANSLPFGGMGGMAAAVGASVNVNVHQHATNSSVLAPASDASGASRGTGKRANATAAAGGGKKGPKGSMPVVMSEFAGNAAGMQTSGTSASSRSRSRSGSGSDTSGMDGIVSVVPNGGVGGTAGMGGMETVLMAYQGNRKILASMNIKELFVLETQLSDAIKNVRKAINLRNEQKFLCNICMRNEKEQVIDPCGHVTCRQCVDRSMDKCPICQGNIKKILFLNM